MKQTLCLLLLWAALPACRRPAEPLLAPNPLLTDTGQIAVDFNGADLAGQYKNWHLVVVGRTHPAEVSVCQQPGINLVINQ